MPSTPRDFSLAVGDGARRMTYAELADVRGISGASAERLVRRRWSRQAGNDGVVRVLVPLTEARKPRKTAAAIVRISAADVTPDNGADVRTSPLISADVRTLREQLDRAEVTIAFQRREIEMLFRLLADRRPWWRRWFR
jgi:hypothetical protein